jgi:hypothetical protein
MDIADFNKYYENNLKPIIDHDEDKRLSRVKSIKYKAISSFIIISIAIILTFILTFTDLGNNYNLFAKNFDQFMDQYQNWYLMKNWFFRIFLPSKLVWWNFPSPTFISAILLLILFTRLMLPIFSYKRGSFKNKIIMPLLKYTGDFVFTDKNTLLESNFHQALDFPKFDLADFDKACYSLDYKNTRITICELSLLSEIIEIHNFKTPIFKGILAACDFKDKKIELDGKTIIVTNLNDSLKEKIDQQKLENIIIDKATIFSNIAQNLSDKKILNLADILKKNSDVINELNDYDQELIWDEIIANKYNRYIPPEAGHINDKTIECAILDNVLYFMIPFNRDLFAKNSVFTKCDYRKDIDLVLQSINMIKSSIDSMSQ